MKDLTEEDEMGEKGIMEVIEGKRRKNGKRKGKEK